MNPKFTRMNGLNDPIKEQISCTIPQSSSNNWPRASSGYPMNPCPSEIKEMNSFSKPSMMSHNGLNQMAYTMPTMGSQQGSFMQQGMGGHLMNNNPMPMGMMNSPLPGWGMQTNTPNQRPSYPFMSPMAPPTPQAINNQGQQFQQQRQNYYDDMPLYVENPQIPQNQYQMTPNENFARVNSNPNPCNNSNCLRCKKPTM